MFGSSNAAIGGTAGRKHINSPPVAVATGELPRLPGPQLRHVSKENNLPMARTHSTYSVNCYRCGTLIESTTATGECPKCNTLFEFQRGTFPAVQGNQTNSVVKIVRSAFILAAALWTINISTQAVLEHIDEDVRLRAQLAAQQRSALLDIQCQPRQAGPVMLAEKKTNEVNQEKP